MSSSGDDTGPGRREVAYRLFAAEFDDATVSYAESDEERAPKYVVTPTGARVNRMFAVGVLTEVESVNEDVLRARVVDYTGAFVSYAGQYQPDAAAFFERTGTPAFVALTGKARTFQPEDSDRVYTSVRPESVSEVDSETRDRWTVSAAEATLRRVAAMADARSMDVRGDDLRAALLDRGYDESLAAGIPIALERYGTTVAYLDAVREVALDALEVVAGDREEVRALDVAPDDAGTTSLGPLPEAVRRAPAADDVAATHEVDTAAPTDAAAESATDEDEATASAASEDPDANGPTTPETADDPTGEPASPSAAAEAEPTDPVTESTAESTPDPSASTESAADDTSDELGDFGGDDDIGDFDDGGSDGAADDDIGDFDDGGSDGAADDDTGDFDDGDLYELDEDERREVEEEFDVGFESGAEVGDPGEAGIDVPGPEDLEDDGAETPDAETAAATGDDETGDAADAADVDLEDAAVDAMSDLDDGDGAAHDEVVAAVVEAYGADPGAVADAIEDALMSGKCYEPSEDRLKAI